jgi:hypothetical protein
MYRCPATAQFQQGESRCGVGETIHQRKTVNLYWFQLMRAMNALIYIVTIWWGMFWWSGQQEWSYFQFLLLIVYAIFLFLCASLVFPWDIPEGFDFEDHFYQTRPWFFSVLAVAWLIDLPETIAKSDGELRALPSTYLAFALMHFTCAIVGAF